MHLVSNFGEQHDAACRALVVLSLLFLFYCYLSCLFLCLLLLCVVGVVVQVSDGGLGLFHHALLVVVAEEVVWSAILVLVHVVLGVCVIGKLDLCVVVMVLSLQVWI